MLANKNHYLLLDGVRGLAALAVFLYHLKAFVFFDTPFGESDFFVKSYLAVDLFFLMSGLVIARSYEAKLLSNTMTFKEFFWVRLIRLYPLYIAGLTLGVGYVLFRYLIKPEPTDMFDLGRSFGLNALLLPDLWQKEIFVLNPAAWSLCLEWIINIIYALVAIKLSKRILCYITFGSAVLLICTALYTGGLDIGWSRENFGGGFVRILFSFTLGVLMYRIISEGRRIKSINPIILTLPILLILTAPIKQDAVYYDLLSVLVVFPIFVYFACGAHTVEILKRPFLVFGQVSYALYILHTPLIMWIGGAWKILTGSNPEDYAVTSFSLMAVVIIFLSYLATIAFDEPVRKYFKNRQLRQKLTKL